METEGSLKMNDLLAWLEKHPDVELTILIINDKSFSIRLTDRETHYNIKFTQTIFDYHKLSRDDFDFILDELYDKLKFQHKIGIMMEE